MKKNQLSIYLKNNDKIMFEPQANKKNKLKNKITIKKISTDKFTNSSFYKPITKFINFDDF
ncbi:hypothetical protein GCM10023210_28860 [Chryseobacterium ginsengisoli]|uniref:Prevent-host-death protein n=1 Tax=Chryseobacterium ginsengisoli TaxID=363853 RepID=A0ABP9MF86_9FLAO